jgi:DNA-binding NtrC family response regulator
MKILLAEDEKISRITLTQTLAKEGYDVTSCEDGRQGLGLLQSNHFDVLITDLRLPGVNGMELLKTAKEKLPYCIVILMTAYATVENAVEALKLGAYDYLTKPFTPDRLLSMLSHIRELHTVLDENKELKKRLESFENKSIVGQSKEIAKLKQTIQSVAGRDYTVLIEGESGTGKELVARALHFHSPRKENPFITINCASIPESLLESELFGHEKGAFTGAIKRHVGYFERAHGGTIFIDDIDDFPLALQVKLLRVLQEREIIRVGGTVSVTVDVRVICATKVDLKERVSKSLFREDLFYRLDIIRVKIPPLRERKEDILPLLTHFFEKYGNPDKQKVLTIEVMDILQSYSWPGNVRELENLSERLIALSETVTPEEIVRESISLGQSVQQPPEQYNGSYPPYTEFMKQKENEIVAWALEKSDHNISAAAELLGLPRSTLRSKLGAAGKGENFTSGDQGHS